MKFCIFDVIIDHLDAHINLYIKYIQRILEIKKMSIMQRNRPSKGRFRCFRIVPIAGKVLVFSLAWLHEKSQFRQIAYLLYTEFLHLHAQE